MLPEQPILGPQTAAERLVLEPTALGHCSTDAPQLMSRSSHSEGNRREQKVSAQPGEARIREKKALNWEGVSNLGTGSVCIF